MTHRAGITMENETKISLLNASLTSTDSPESVTFNSTEILPSEEVNNDIFKQMRYVFLARDMLCLPPTIFGNILILIAIARVPGLCRGTSSLLIGNLAISDLIMGLLVFPVDLGIRISDEIAKFLTDCSLYQTVVYIGISASVLNLFLLSIERFHAIVRPLHHIMVFTKRRIYFMIMLIWLFVATFGTLSVVTWNRNIEDLSCPMKTMIKGLYLRLLCYLIVSTMTLNTIFFIAIARVVLQKSALVGKLGIQHNCIRNTGTKRDIRQTFIMLIVSGLFVLFWGPFCVISVIPERSDTLKNVHIMLAHVGMFNSCSNWIVYGWRSARFRRAFKLVLKCQSKEKEVPNGLRTDITITTQRL